MEENQSVLVMSSGVVFQKKQSIGSYFPMFSFGGFYCVNYFFSSGTFVPRTSVVRAFCRYVLKAN